MAKWTYSSGYYAFLTLATFLMAIISFSGIFFFKEDITGRLISGSAWSLVTLGWLSKFFKVKMRNKQQSEYR